MGLGSIGNQCTDLSYSKHALARFDLDQISQPCSHGAGNDGARSDYEHDAKHCNTPYLCDVFCSGVGYPRRFLHKMFCRPLLSIYTIGSSR